MPVDIPTPFDLLDTNNWRNADSVGSPTSEGAKSAGGVRITDNGWQWYSQPENVEEGPIWNLNAGFNPEDWSNKLFIVSHTFNAQNRMEFQTLANHGISIWLFSEITGSPSYEKFVVGGNDTKRGKFGNGHLCMVIDAEKKGHTSSGSFDVTNMNAYAVVVKEKNITSTNNNWNYISRATKMGTLKSDSDIPRIYGTGSRLSDLHDEVETFSYSTVNHNYTTKLGTTYEYNCPFVIGKTGETTYFDDNGITVVSPPDDDSQDPRFQLTTGSMKVYLDLQSGDSASFTGTYVWGTRAPFDFNSSETVTLNGASFKGMGEFTVGIGISGNATFDDVDIVILNPSGDLNGSTFTNPYSKYLLKIG